MLKILLKGCNVEHFFFLTVHVSIVDFLFLFFNGTLSCNGFVPISLQHHKQCLVWWPSKACALKKKKCGLTVWLYGRRRYMLIKGSGHTLTVHMREYFIGFVLLFHMTAKTFMGTKAKHLTNYIFLKRLNYPPLISPPLLLESWKTSYTPETS